MFLTCFDKKCGRFGQIFMFFEQKAVEKIESLKDLTEALLDGSYADVLNQADDINIPLSDFDKYTFWNENHYTRNCIAKDDFFELILLCWELGHKTKIHCHNQQECWVKVIEGGFSESVYEQAEESDQMQFVSTDIVSQNEVTTVENHDVFHSLENINRGRSMSLHLYMKPITHCMYFDEESRNLRKVELSYYSFRGEKV